MQLRKYQTLPALYIASISVSDVIFSGKETRIFLQDGPITQYMSNTCGREKVWNDTYFN